jgi:hypothetical protein
MSATAPTSPIPPQPFQPVDASTAGGAGPAASGPSTQVAPPTEPVPWYRRAWVIVVAAVLIAVLSFGIGFIAGNAASLFGGLFGGPGRGAIDERPGFPDDGPRGGDGDFPGLPGGSSQEG